MVVICNHGSGCELRVCKQVLGQSNWLSKGLAEFLDRGSVNTTQFYDQEVNQGFQIIGTVAYSIIGQ
jgi:hypothetical protein